MIASAANKMSKVASDFRELSGAELEQVSGAMKWERGTINPNVIDVRGRLSTNPYVNAFLKGVEQGKKNGQKPA